MNPNQYCKPVPKREAHRLKIRKYVTSGNYRFGAGTDSAPHEESAKAKCCGCAAGIFTAPCAVELYTTVFDEDNALENLNAFLSINFLEIYGMKPSYEMVSVFKKPFLVPEKIGSVNVFHGGKYLPWRIL